MKRKKRTKKSRKFPKLYKKAKTVFLNDELNVEDLLEKKKNFQSEKNFFNGVTAKKSHL